MSDATAFMITSVLQDVKLNGSGTPRNVAVKTGTTNFDAETKARYHMPADTTRDSWAVGYSTKTVIAMWYGYPEIIDGYYLHNIPAAFAKDAEFVALVNSGAMESNREAFKAPASVVKRGSEYYKKGHEPAKEEVEEKLGAPGNFSVHYDEATGTVTLSWSGVGRLKDDGEFGEFGYKVYKDGTLIGWTKDTRYTLTTSAPSGSYKVIAAYKGFSGVSADSATVNYSFEPSPEEPTPSEEPTPDQQPDPGES